MKMGAENFTEMSNNAYSRYRPNITKEQKNHANIFKLGYQAAMIEHSKMIEELQYYKDTTTGLLKIDKEVKVIADNITNELNKKLNLKSVDVFDIQQFLITYLDSVMFRI